MDIIWIEREREIGRQIGADTHSYTVKNVKKEDTQSLDLNLNFSKIKT